MQVLARIPWAEGPQELRIWRQLLHNVGKRGLPLSPNVEKGNPSLARRVGMMRRTRVEASNAL
jgi:hypothetical protein